MSNNYYITVNANSDYWGSNADDYDCESEANKIQSAAESAGIPVIRDVHHSRQQYTVEGDEMVEIDWFSDWCNAGYAWDEDRWTEWFSSKVPAATN
jgi:hypothetical protein